MNSFLKLITLPITAPWNHFFGPSRYAILGTRVVQYIEHIEKAFEHADEIETRLEKLKQAHLSAAAWTSGQVNMLIEADRALGEDLGSVREDIRSLAATCQTRKDQQDIEPIKAKLEKVDTQLRLMTEYNPGSITKEHDVTNIRHGLCVIEQTLIGIQAAHEKLTQDVQKLSERMPSEKLSTTQLQDADYCCLTCKKLDRDKIECTDSKMSRRFPSNVCFLGALGCGTHESRNVSAKCLQCYYLNNTFQCSREPGRESISMGCKNYCGINFVIMEQCKKCTKFNHKLWLCTSAEVKSRDRRTRVRGVGISRICKLRHVD